MDFETFIAMGGYAAYVWGAYGLALVGYGGILAWSLARRAKIEKQDTAK